MQTNLQLNIQILMSEVGGHIDTESVAIQSKVNYRIIVRFHVMVGLHNKRRIVTCVEHKTRKDHVVINGFLAGKVEQSVCVAFLRNVQ